MKLIKKIAALVLVAVVSAGMCVLDCPAASFRPKLTVLGDSIAAGYGLDDMQDSYAALISAEHDLELSNDAVSGDTTSDMLMLLQSQDKVKNDVAAADIIVISIGGNDLIAVMKGLSAYDKFDILMNGANAAVIKESVSSVSANLNSICSQIRSLNPDCAVLFQTLYNPLYANSEYSSFASGIDAVAPVFNSQYTALCSEYTGFFTADVYTAFDNYYSTSGNYDIIAADGIHPSVSGHRLIADVLNAELERLASEGLFPTAPAGIPTTAVPVSTSNKTGSTAALSSVTVTGSGGTYYYLLGDIDGSDTVTIKDATIIQKYAAEMIRFSNDVAKLCTDVNQDTEVNIKDATVIQKYIALIPTGTKVGQYIVYNGKSNS